MNSKVIQKCLFEFWQTVRKIAYCLERRHLSANDAIFPNLQGVVNRMDGGGGVSPDLGLVYFTHTHVQKMFTLYVPLSPCQLCAYVKNKVCVTL